MKLNSKWLLLFGFLIGRIAKTRTLPNANRSDNDILHELQALDSAHAQNESSRDTFAGLAHTALFAASVSFVGDVTPLDRAVFKPALIAGWTADVVGLLALTISFTTARRAIDVRRQALYEPVSPTNRLADAVNALALWSFPVALVCLFLFVTANVVHANDQQASIDASRPRQPRINATSARPFPKQSLQAVDRRRSRTPASR